MTTSPRATGGTLIQAASTWAVLAVAIACLLWELAARATGPGAAVPPLTSALGALWRERAFLAHHAGITVLEAVLGLGLALAVAMATATSFALWRRANEALTPFVLASQTVPLVVIGPLLAAVIGEGLFATVIITAWLCWFPAMIAFTQGFSKVHPDRLAIFRVARATPWQTFARLQFPGAASSIASGVRAAAGFALIGAIVAEYGGANAGLGAVIIQHTRGINKLLPDAQFGLVILCSLLGVAITWGAHKMARYALRAWLHDDA